MSLSRFGQPFFGIFSKFQGETKFSVYQKISQKAEDIGWWARYIIRKEENNHKSSTKIIGKLTTINFIPSVQDPNTDSIVFVGHPSMKKYKDAFQKFVAISSLFEDISSVVFYEFNSKTDRVEGLDFSSETDPVFIVWPATTEPSGTTIPGDAYLPNIIEIIFQTLSSEIPQSQADGLSEKLEKLI
jgi:hypothetical protein